MVKCTHKGCGKEFTETENKDNACQYHEGAPVFHEGLKGWSCCKKRVVDFDEFLAIPGCTWGRHSNEVPETPKKEVAEPALQSNNVTKEGVEVYGQTVETPVEKPVVVEEKKPEEKKPEVEEEDDESVPVAEGTTCKRRGCGRVWKDQATSRGEGAEAKCRYHPGAPIFHEGSKGWSCCSRKVLDFDEFLKIEGCKEGKHLFVGSSNKSAEELVDCRTDWYQTQTTVILSIFAKNKEDTKVEFNDQSIDVDIKMKGNKRFKKTFPLFAPINKAESKHEVLSTKIELVLKKTSGMSWASLEPNSNVTTWTTFGVEGTVGTIGSKQMHYNADSPLEYLKK